MKQDMHPDLAKLLNQPDTIEFEGKAFKLRELTLLQRAKFSQWLRDRALAAVELAARTCPEHVADELRRGWRNDCAAGLYDFGGDCFVIALKTFAGQVKALHLCLAEDHPEVTEEYAEKMWAAERNKLSTLVAEKIGDPKFLAALVGRFPGLTPSRPSQTSRSASRSKKSKRSRPRK